MAYCLDSNYFRIFFPNNVLLCLCLFLISRPSYQFHQLCHFFNFFISLIISFFRIGTVHVSVSSTVCFSFSASSGCSGCKRLKYFLNMFFLCTFPFFHHGCLDPAVFVSYCCCNATPFITYRTLYW